MSDLVPADKLSRLPERYQRRAREIASRVREIDALIRPCDKTAIRDCVIRLRGQLLPQPGIEAKDMAAEFVAACSDLPEWALSEATSDYLGGRVENHTGRFMPTCAEFAKRAREIILPFIAERSSLRVEAEKLVERWQDEDRRNRIAIERADPSVRARAQALLDQAKLGQPRQLPARSRDVSPEAQKQIDALKKHRPLVSKIGHEPGKTVGE